MKPGDHPDFFRLPPPPGRSRESTIVLARDGRFFHEGQPVEHGGMRRAFASWLTRHPDDGRYILNNGYDWSYVTVEGAARFVTSVRADAQAGLRVTLLDGCELPFDPNALSSDPGGLLWLELASGERAQFTPAAQLQLAPWLEEPSGGQAIGIRIAGQFWPIEGAARGA